MKIKKIIPDIISVCLVIVLIFVTFDFLCYPEKYVTSWKYQLKNDIESGNKQAIEYYEKNYTNKGKELF